MARFPSEQFTKSTRTPPQAGAILVMLIAVAGVLTGCFPPVRVSIPLFASECWRCAQQAPASKVEPVEPPLVAALRKKPDAGDQADWQVRSLHIAPVPPAKFYITPSDLGDLYLGYYGNGQLAAALRWRGWGPMAMRGYVGSVMMWYPSGAIRSIDSRSGLHESRTWDEEGRLLAGSAPLMTNPWNPGPLDNPPPPQDVIDSMLSDLLSGRDLPRIPPIPDRRGGLDQWYR